MLVRPVPGLRAVTAAAAASALTASLLAATPASADQKVSYLGYEFSVPTGWSVVNLENTPNACVRFDHPAVYLGTPSADQDCPASAVGGADALLVQPTKTANGGDPSRDVDLPQRALRLTFAPGTMDNVRQRILDSGRVDGAAPSQRAVPEQPTEPAQQAPQQPPQSQQPQSGAQGGAPGGPQAQADGRSVHPGYFSGDGFDACAAPSQRAMNAWRKYSPYRAIGVYLGGVSRACSQPNLTANWVRQQHANGWHLMPIHIGLQAPCSKFRRKMSTNAAQAKLQGRYAASDAITTAKRLGISAGSVIYNDIEAFDRNKGACKDAVLYFLTGWTQRLHESKYRSGVYSSVSSIIRDLVGNYNSSRHIRPDHIWFAWWNGQRSVDAVKYIPRTMWRRARVHQYSGNTKKTFGGVTINIDGNFLDVK